MSTPHTGDAAARALLSAAASPGSGDRQPDPIQTSSGAHDEGEGVVRTGGDPNSWTLQLPPRADLLSANDRAAHWGRRQRITEAIRSDAATVARSCHVPPLECARIVVELRFPDARHRDPHNWLPAAKAAVDGLVDARVLPDDDARYLIGPDMRRGPVERHPGRRRLARLVLHITDLEVAP